MGVGTRTPCTLTLDPPLNIMVMALPSSPNLPESISTMRYSNCTMTRSEINQTTSSRFLSLKSSARGTQLILCKLGKETRREWGEARSFAARRLLLDRSKKRKENAKSGLV